jgi:geranylgeranyl diphosphate synthase type I
VVESPPAEPDVASGALEAVRARVDPALLRFLGDRRAELAAMDPSAAGLVEEIERLVRAGGKRIRPALCYWAFRAAGGADGEPIVNVGVALELLHTSALVHDDVMDRTDERRGVPATHVRFAAEAPAGIDAGAFGVAAAILVGDLALVLSEHALRTSGFRGAALSLAMGRFDRMRIEMATGQFLDVSGAADRDRVAALKSGSYTAVGPVSIGAALAGADVAAEGVLGVFARLVGAAFQLRDDAMDGDAPAGSGAEVGALIDRAVGSLEGAPLRAEAVGALAELADLLRLPEGA